MEQPAALTQPAALASLLKRLEPDAQPIETDGRIFAGGVAVRSQEDPGRRVFSLVPASVPTARAEGEAKWIAEHRDALETLLRGTRVSLANIIFPGEWPTRPARERIRGGATVRLVSAAHHLWADRLRFHDDRGNIDDKARRAFLSRLGQNWTDVDERHYTEAALREVDSSVVGQSQARGALLRNRPDLMPGHVTVIYGPGGIGKTFFLRRVTDRLTRLALSDPCLGIPVFAELPLLLHSDTLETWLSHRGVRLRLEQIRALVAAGVIVPVLDALDELVRGQAREGSRAFLEQLGQTAGSAGKILLSSRDYYLNLDPLVREGLGDESIELSIGYFTKAGRRRYVQVRAQLNEAAAARWAGKLEEQATDALGGISDDDLESLIGHPLFLEAFCQIILAIPENQRVSAVDEFRIASPNVFGEIVSKVLEREEVKAQPGWNAKTAGDLEGDWKHPFSPAHQHRLLRALVLLVARDGAKETFRRSSEDERYRELYHGVFRFTTGVPVEDGASRKEIARDLIRSILGEPDVAEHVPYEEIESRRVAALDEYAGVLLQHTLSDTRPRLVEDLVFATRHRAYFDYLLADALLEELRTALIRPDADAREHFINWCLAHHIFESPDGGDGEPPFASCLDFVLWHREALDQAMVLLIAYLSSEELDDVLGSYVASLGLAVLLRAALRAGELELAEQIIGVASSAQLQLLENLVPAISGLHVRNSSFGDLAIGESRLRGVSLTECDFRHLALRGTHMVDVALDDCSVDELTLAGTIHCANSRLDIHLEPGKLALDATSQLFFDRCEIDGTLLAELEAAKQLRPDVIHVEACQPILEEDESPYTRGRFFLNKLVSLSRRHGHDEYAVYEPKLRGRTGATPEAFTRAVGVLVSAGAVTRSNDMVFLSDAAAENLYSAKERPGVRAYDDVAAYWELIVKELDEALA